MPGARRASLFSTPAPLPSLLEETVAATATTTTLPAASNGSDTNAEEEDTGVLLARMKEMVEGVKRRQSMGTPAARLSLSPQKKAGFSLLAGETPGSRLNLRRMLIEEADGVEEEEEEEEGGSDKENGEEVPEHTDAGFNVENADNAGPRARAPPQTPRMDDLRHVFHAPHPEPRTPHLRAIFAQKRGERAAAIGTPTFEGMGEMMATPAGYRAAARRGRNVELVEEDEMVVEVEGGQDAVDELEHEMPEQEMEPEPEPEPEPVLTRTTRRKTSTPTAAAATTRRTPRSVPTTAAKKPVVADLDTVMENGEGTESGASSNVKTAARKTRTRAIESDQVRFY